MGLRLIFVAVCSVLMKLIKISMGTMGPFLPEDKPFKTIKGLLGYV